MIVYTVSMAVAITDPGLADAAGTFKPRQALPVLTLTLLIDINCYHIILVIISISSIFFIF